MIKKMSKSITGERMTVSIQCFPRKYASYERKILTTSQLLDMLEEKENVKDIIREPRYQVANYNSAQTRLFGEWEFKMKPVDIVEVEIEEEPPRPTKAETSGPQKTKKSIRNRMSKLANHDRESKKEKE